MREIRQYGSAPGHTQSSNGCQCDLRRLPFKIRHSYKIKNLPLSPGHPAWGFRLALGSEKENPR